MRRILTNTALGFALFLAIAHGAGYSLEQRQPDLTAEQVAKIKVATEALETFAENLPDCSKGFPTGARKEVWDNYLRYCEPGVIVPKGEGR